LKNAIIIGGGISGLLTAIQLVNSDIPCSVIEKRKYPFHRVCGEYISNEAKPFLTTLGLFPSEFDPPEIQRFQLSSVSGRSEVLPLDLGGFGISRFSFDHFLYEKAKAAGVNFLLQEEVEKIEFADDEFLLQTQTRQLQSPVVIGAFGKRSKLDIQLSRRFIEKRSPYVGVKYHIITEHPDDLIALHNFRGGYCGISRVEGGRTNLCYLTHRNNLKRYKNIREMEEAVLFENPLLRQLFRNAQFVFDRPETINEISFETKAPVENHVLMAGDAAGMITPLCGNGMAMAVRCSKLVADHIVEHVRKRTSRSKLEEGYARGWNRIFSNRLWFGRQVQRLFGNERASNLAVNLAIHFRPLANAIIKGTHGKPFD
jgi:flavin-dependent dehydrogenase